MRLKYIAANVIILGLKLIVKKYFWVSQEKKITSKTFCEILVKIHLIFDYNFVFLDFKITLVNYVSEHKNYFSSTSSIFSRMLFIHFSNNFVDLEIEILAKHKLIKQRNFFKWFSIFIYLILCLQKKNQMQNFLLGIQNFVVLLKN